MKRVVFGLLALALTTGWAAQGRAAGLTLSIRDGRVSLDAQEVTLRQILTEWARVGKTQIVNLERVNTGPVTLKFDGVPEEQALDIILRALPGYMAAPRAAVVADESIYDRIVILPTTTVVAAPPRSPLPGYQDPSPNVTQLRPAAQPLNPGILPEPPVDNDPAVAAAAAAGLTAVPAPQPSSLASPFAPLQPPVRGAGTPMVPSEPQTPPASPAPSNPWNAPAGTSRPGLATPPPPPSTNPQLNRSTGIRPQQADQ